MISEKKNNKEEEKEMSSERTVISFAISIKV
jgi:hypothetical protein